MIKGILNAHNLLGDKLRRGASKIKCLFLKLADKISLKVEDICDCPQTDGPIEDICDCRQMGGLIEDRVRPVQTQWIAQLGNWSYDLNTNELVCSEENYEILDVEPETFAPSYENFIELVHPEDRSFVKESIEKVILQKKINNIEHRVVLKDGRVRFLHQIVRVVYDKEGQPIRILGTVQDITSLKQQEQQIRKLSYYDQLTGLPNRVMFLKEIDCLTMLKCAKHKDFAVLLLDLDRFKIVNDSLGHEKGDLLLKAIAKRLEYNIITDVYNIYRLGGDEFAIIINEIDLVEKIAKQVMDIISEPFMIGGHQIFITTSIGIAHYPENGHSGNALIKNADAAMYQAKEMGKNQFIYYTADINERAIDRLFLENELRNAIERQEFDLHYQRQVDASGDNIIVAEALLRWRHPEMGLISPDNFIPLAEELGLIVPIGEWVIRTACLQNRSWQEEGFPPIKIAVNISIRQFQRDDFVQMVEEILREAELEAKYLELEITESIAMYNIDHVMSVLDQLKRLGVSVAIDDFGTGYSSLNYLKELSIDVLKIDKTFINRVPNEQKNAAIVESIINMAHNLDLKVVAEGVETEEQLSFLKACKCNLMQGFLFNRPVPPELFW